MTESSFPDGGMAAVSSGAYPFLRRNATWAEWEAGRAARRALAMQITGGRNLRRTTGKPRKDVLLRRLNHGERGLRFRPIKPVEQQAGALESP